MALTDLIGSLVSSGVNVLNNERAMRQQLVLQKNAQDYNTLMFDKANQYNSPVAQMQRFKAAGLNPNLIYGQMANTASAPSMNAPSAPAPAHMDSFSTLGLLTDFANLKKLQAEKDNIEADTEKKEAETDESRSRIELIGKQQGLTQAQTDECYQNIEESNKRIDKMQNEIELIGAQYIETLERAGKNRNEATKLYYEALSAQVDAYYADERNRAQIDKLKSETGLNEAQAKAVMIQSIAYKSLSESEVVANNALADKYRAEIDKLSEEQKAIAQQVIQGKGKTEFAEKHPNLMRFTAGVNILSECANGVADLFVKKSEAFRNYGVGAAGFGSAIGNVIGMGKKAAGGQFGKGEKSLF